MIRNLARWKFTALFVFAVLAVPNRAQALADGEAQLVHPGATGQIAPPATITLRDALARAQTVSAQLLAATTDAALAGQDRVQARAALLPQISSEVQYLGTQGNGVLPSGRYVSNDGVHMYRAWGVFHQDLSPATLVGTGMKRAAAAEAIAKAKAEITRRGLNVAVTKAYYALVASQRKYASAQEGLAQAQRFLDIARSSEQAGQAAHSDTVKAEIQYQQQQQNYEEARLAIENDRLDLAVMLSPDLNENFAVVDDLDAAAALPQFAEAEGLAERQNPNLRAAIESLRQADLDVTSARNAFLPTIGVDTDYGIEANHFALRSLVAADPELGPLPNLGYFVTATVSIPVWDWGVLRSKLNQSRYRRQQARVELSQIQREAVSSLYQFYNEAVVARSAMESLRRTAELATESLRLVNLRYQAGESSALEAVDAQNALIQARNSYADGQVRYRVAIANLQTLTGGF